MGKSNCVKGDKEKTQTADWGVPNWENPGEYNYIKSLNKEAIRWEFLRRDKKYRSLFEKKTRPTEHFLLGRYINPKRRGDELLDGFAFADSIRRGKGLALIQPSLKSLLFKNGEPDPQQNLGAFYGPQLIDLWDAGYAVIAFDPFRPIDGQVKAAKKELQEIRKSISPEVLEKAGSKRTINLKDAAKLLRVIDARNEGTSFKEIGTKIYGIKDYSDAAATGKQHYERAITYWRIL